MCRNELFLVPKGVGATPERYVFFLTRPRFGFFYSRSIEIFGLRNDPFFRVFDLRKRLVRRRRQKKSQKTISEKYRRYSILIETVKTLRDWAYEILSPGWGDDGLNHLNHMIRGIINSM